VSACSSAPSAAEGAWLSSDRARVSPQATAVAAIRRVPGAVFARDRRQALPRPREASARCSAAWRGRASARHLRSPGADAQVPGTSGRPARTRKCQAPQVARRGRASARHLGAGRSDQRPKSLRSDCSRRPESVRCVRLGSVRRRRNFPLGLCIDFGVEHRGSLASERKKSGNERTRSGRTRRQNSRAAAALHDQLMTLGRIRLRAPACRRAPA
jgi:hypothetical protein